LRIAFKCEYRTILDIAGSIDFPLINGDLPQFKVIVWKLDFMIIVNTEHIFGPNSQAKASIGKLPNFDLEYSGLGNGFLCDEVHPIIDKNPFDSKSIGSWS
jgi:hypothetical protein